MGIRLLIDSGSEKSFMLESIAVKAKLPTVSVENLKIYTFGTTIPQIKEFKKKRVVLKDSKSDSCLECEILTTDRIVGASLIQSPSSEVVNTLEEKGFMLSDQGGGNEEIGILIGNDLISRVL